ERRRSRSRDAVAPAPAATPVTVKKRLSYHEQRELVALPEVIEGLEVEAGQLNRTIHGPNFYREPADTIKAALARLEQVQTELEQSYVRWEELEARRGSFRG
ncbi:MAG: ABC transporter ATP-binding protein, partial [Acidobacteriota bacterium]